MITATPSPYTCNTRTKTRWFTGLETAPLHHRRFVDASMSDTLDNISTVSDDLLATSLPKHCRLSEYTMYSIVVFYHNCECDGVCKCSPTNNAGYISNYTSHCSGRPAVHQYGWDTVVAWSARDYLQAETMRHAMQLTRYALFVRALIKPDKKHVVWHWEYHHSGQLPLIYKEV